MASDRSRRRLLTTGVLGTVLIVTVYLAGGLFSALKSTARAVEFPFAWAANEVARPIGHLVAGVVDYSDVVAQNQQLRYQLGQAVARADANSRAAAQLALIAQATHVPWAASLGTVMAQVVSISPTSFSATITIDRGQDDGVMNGMPVVADGGLVGRVTDAGPHTSLIRLLSDTGSVVEASFGNGQTPVLVTGQGLDNPLAVSSIPETASLGAGSRLSTDGLQGGLFPPGIPIGRVTKLFITPGASTYSVALRPTANLNELAYVDVVLWEPST